MIVQSFEQAAAFISAIGATGQIIDFRAIHDVDKARPAIPFRDTLENAWSSIVHYNSGGYGIFCTVAAMDGNGRELANVHAIRAHYVDLDNLSAQQNLERASVWYPLPSFAVNSSPGKFHCYWPTVSYRDNDRFSIIQRKLRQFFDGDKAVIDATRVMRLPGTLHLKRPDQPHLVTCFTLPGYGFTTPPEALEAALQQVNVIDVGGVRKSLGDPELAAPSLQAIVDQLHFIDPNALDRGEWISVTAAIKQAGWTHGTEQQLYEIWSNWCARYHKNDLAENQKQWASIRDTETGWQSLRRRAPQAVLGSSGNVPSAPAGAVNGHAVPSSVMPMPAPPEPSIGGEMLNAQEQAIYFKGCTYIGRMGEILTPFGRFMNAGKFNGQYGGKKFIIDSVGKTTNEPWQAATRSTLWTVPKVDHVRFLPERAQGEIVRDQLGRDGVNTYIPVPIDAVPGDVSPWLRHMENLLPYESDRKIYYEYLAHNVKFRGFKIPWSPMLQSAEGAGKSFFQELMELILGEMYVYTPKAEELVNSGSTFNAWMRAKLMIVVNEIKVDERRELIEILKPMISDKRVEVQSKGIDQEMEDNPANWLFFSNYKDAVPINKSSRRYAIFYSAIQSEDDLRARGMVDKYFPNLFQWLRNGGHRHIAHWLLNYPIGYQEIAMRAPDTTSKPEALRQSYGPIERLIVNAIEDQLSGFRNGWASVTAVLKLAKAQGLRVPSPKTIETILENMQFNDCGRTPRPYFQEDVSNRSHVYNKMRGADPSQFGRMQGYE